MEREEEQSYDFMDQPLSYEFSEIEIKNLKIAARKRPEFYGQEDLDENTKAFALKASSFVVSLVSFTGDSVLSQNCGAIIETDGNTNIVITSLNLTRQCDGVAKFGKNIMADNLKVVVYANDGNWYLGEVFCCDYFYNLAALKFNSKTIFKPAKFCMIDDAGVPESDFLRRHSTKAKKGDTVIVVGRYFYEPNAYMAAPGVLSLDRFRPDKYDCNELLTISSRFTRV
ncbi:uncharacterized protein LOC141652062 [Silene latifolia]|uniref:uncharacterized protein LOC141652062 n=1 Tax=Silene latifolia TaxID=37657 RepID=UPI003D78A14F